MSNYVRWNKMYCVNHYEIDKQHKYLFELVNELSKIDKAAATMEVAEVRRRIGIVIDDLIQYVDQHFTFEENLMREIQYPEKEYNDHIKKHKDLVSQVMDLKSSFDSGANIVLTDVINFAKFWLIVHILGVDKQYGEYLVKAGVSQLDSAERLAKDELNSLARSARG